MDAPLLGKHVGTYWCGWQVRGQESLGFIEKTDALKAGRRREGARSGVVAPGTDAAG